MIDVLIVEKHPLIVTGVESALLGSDIAIVGKTRDIGEAVSQYKKLMPSVAIVGISFPEVELSGLDIMEQLLEYDSNAKIIILSELESAELIKEAYSLGAKAFIPKSLEFDIPETISLVVSGQQYFHPAVATKLAIYAVAGEDSSRSRLDSLSASELRGFTLSAQGYTQKEIADKTGVALRTITTMFGSIKDKLHIERQTDFTILAIKHKLIDIDNPIIRRPVDGTNN